MELDDFLSDRLRPREDTDGVRASIDIGTNTVLLLVAGLENGKLRVLHQLERMPRLGQGVDRHGVIGQPAMQRVIEVLVEYRDLVFERFGAIPVTVTATSAVRDASNRVEFLWLAEEATGYRIRILSGREEAACSFYGALSMSGGFIGERQGKVAVLDIGGGSTELAVGTRRDGVLDAISLDMGSVRCTERFFAGLWETGKVGEATVARRRQAETDMRGWVMNLLENGEFRRVAPPEILVGVSGTVLTAAALIYGITETDPAELDGLIITREQVLRELSRIMEHPPEISLSRNPKWMEGRVDLLPSGLIILDCVLQVMGSDRIMVSSGGVRHGAIILSLFV